jgi:death-on-curing protein
MSEPFWLDRDAVLILHDEQIAEHGGAPGLRDAGLLESALARPRNAWSYGERDLARLAALYAGGLVRNHPFLDGNKRAGFLAAYVFLYVNGLDLQTTDGEVIAHTLALAASEIDEETFAAWLRDRSRPL